MFNELIKLLNNCFRIDYKWNIVLSTTKHKDSINKILYDIEDNNGISCYIMFCQNNINSFIPLIVMTNSNSKKAYLILSFKTHRFKSYNKLIHKICEPFNLMYEMNHV